MRVAVEAGGNQRAVMGGQAVRIRECVCVCVPHCGQRSVTDRHRVPLPSDCVGLTVHSCVCKLYFKVAEWIFRHFFFFPADLLGASTNGVPVPSCEQRYEVCIKANITFLIGYLTFLHNNNQ